MIHIIKFNNFLLCHACLSSYFFPPSLLPPSPLLNIIPENLFKNFLKSKFTMCDIFASVFSLNFNFRLIFTVLTKKKWGGKEYHITTPDTQLQMFLKRDFFLKKNFFFFILNVNFYHHHQPHSPPSSHTKNQRISSYSYNVCETKSL